jgi:UDP:flavonoid glycosyltransferase YjiC (YdhE family)
MISLGGRLRTRGHDVLLVATAEFAGLAQWQGIRFVALPESGASSAAIRQKLLNMTRYGALYDARYSVPWNCAAFDAITSMAAKDLMVIAVDRPNLWADLYARAQFGAPVVRVQIDLPYLGRPQGHTEFLPAGRVQSLLRARCEARWRELMLAKGVRVGHLRIGRLWRSMRSSVGAIALWPQWVLGENVANFGCPTFGFLPAPAFSAEPADTGICNPPRSPVVVFVAGTAGTTEMWGRTFFETSAKICEQVQCEGVFLGGEDATHPARRILRRRFLPLAAALRYASAIVHHGGIGTAAAALEAGVPQVIIPRVFAQPANAEWMRRLGVATIMTAKSYTADRGAVALRDVLTNSRYREASQRYSQRCDPERDLVKVCEYLEGPDLLAEVNSRSPRQAALRDWRRRFNQHYDYRF